MVDVDAAACTWPRSTDSPRSPVSAALHGLEARPRGDSRSTARGSVRERLTPRAAGRCARRLFQVQNKRKPRRCHARTVSGFTICTAERQPRHERESHAHSIRSTVVKRTRGRRDRCTTASWCRSARISRCSDARDRTRNRSEWSSETTTDATTGGYRRTPATSIDSRCTMFTVGTALSRRERRRLVGVAAVRAARHVCLVHRGSYLPGSQGHERASQLAARRRRTARALCPSSLSPVLSGLGVD